MKTKIAQNYILQEDRGTLLRAGGPGTIIVTQDNEPEPVEIDSFEQAARHIGKRRLKPIEQIQVRDETGNVDEQATEAAIVSNYEDHYTVLEGLAVPFESGMAVVAGQAEPISYNGTLYNVIQSHTTQADWTPDIVPALFVEIISPTPGLDCPEFVQPTSTRYYNKGDCVAYNGYYYESLINVNTYSPTQYPQGWEKLGPVYDTWSSIAVGEEIKEGRLLFYDGVLYETIKTHNKQNFWAPASADTYFKVAG